MQIQAEDVIKLTSDIWASMLGMELAPCASIDLSGPKQVIAASVEIRGDWKGRVRLDCSWSLAREAAARFVGADPAEVDPEQVRDALSELVNMTAGSVKSLLPSASRLTIPAMDAGAVITGGRSDSLLQSGFSYRGEPLLVTIVRHREPGAAPLPAHE